MAHKGRDRDPTNALPAPSWPTGSTSGTFGRATCCSRPRDGTPISRNTFRTRIWLGAVKAAGVDFEVRAHDCVTPTPRWLLAGGSDLKSVMDRMGHTQIATTQKYLHTLPDADQKNLTALDRVRGFHAASPQDLVK